MTDRVFVHALNTVKKIPKTGASRPPPADRLRLYGLYKQAMEGDVDGVMERPLSYRDGDSGGPGLVGEELRREREKWDAWDAQRGVSRTEAKRRYIEALIDTMHRYASTTAYVPLYPYPLTLESGHRMGTAKREKANGRTGMQGN